MDASDLLAIETLLFSNRIREAQETNPRAHRELINWGAWSRHLTGLKPIEVATPGWCKDYRTQDWKDEELNQETLAAAAPQAVEAKAERVERPIYRQLAAEALDTFLHGRVDWIPSRRCLAVAYVWCFPEYQYATRASKGKSRLDNDQFLEIFSEALFIVEHEGP